MKKALIFTLIVFFSMGIANAQEKETTKKIKIVTIDENGNEQTKEFEIGDETVEWATEEDGMRIIIKKGDGEEEEIIINGANGSAMWSMDVLENKAFLGVVLDEGDEDGAIITRITPDSPAEKAGLKEGDYITAINGKTTNSTVDVVNQIGKCDANEKVSITYNRNGKQEEVSTVLAKREKHSFFEMKDANTMVIDIDDIENDFVFETPDSKAFLGVEPASEIEDIKGVMVLRAIEGSAAAMAGIQTGDVITAINGKQIEDFDQLKAVLENKEPGDKVEVAYLRQGKKKKIELELGNMQDNLNYGKHRVIVKKKK